MVRFYEILDSTRQTDDQSVHRFLVLLLAEVMSNMDWTVTLESDTAFCFFSCQKLNHVDEKCQAGMFFSLPFDSEDGSDMLLRIVGVFFTLHYQY